MVDGEWEVDVTRWKAQKCWVCLDGGPPTEYEREKSPPLVMAIADVILHERLMPASGAIM